MNDDLEDWEDDGAADVHPSETAGDGKRLGETSRYRCKQCGAFPDARRTRRKDAETLAQGINVDSNGNMVSMSQAGGCYHCDSTNWAEGHVTKENVGEKRRRRDGFRGRRIFDRDSSYYL